MKIGFVIICRYNSSRLPGKILMEINGKSILQYIIERLSLVVPENNIVVATSEEKTDNPIAEYCVKNKINVFRGSLDNVALRFLNCGKRNKFDFITRINGDNLFVDVEVLQRMIKFAQTNKYDFVSNVKDRTFPKGMSVEIVRTKHYEEMYSKFNNDGHFEHVTQYLYQNDKNKNYYYFYNTICSETAGIQLAIDNKGDLDFAKKIVSRFEKNHTEYGLKEIFKIIKEINE
ncbi:MAG: hypothetical protein DRJ01_02980 [Bacteroidetes bacterium]|nr:MAG: hypothetical protein DRJ01_02980 [Bacteroidota bacterium]